MEESGQVLPFRRKAEGESTACHDHSGYETDGLAPQERTVLSVARAVFDSAMRSAAVESQFVIGGVIDGDDAKWEAYRLQNETPQPLRLVSDETASSE
jgi:hypothetical protein